MEKVIKVDEDCNRQGNINEDRPSLGLTMTGALAFKSNQKEPGDQLFVPIAANWLASRTDYDEEFAGTQNSEIGLKPQQLPHT